MPDLPKIVHHRLRPSTPEQQVLGQAHPEADLLAAFAEQALSPAEREGVLQHLALCADCRDVVALALPNSDVAVATAGSEREVVGTPVPVKEPTNWFGWTNLHWGRLQWAALAAGIAVAVLVARPELERLSKPNQQVKSVASLPSAPEQPQPSTSTVASPQRAEEPKAEKQPAAKTATELAGLDALSNKSKAAASPSLRSDMPTMLANNLSKKSRSAGAGGSETYRAPTALLAEPAADANLMARANAPPIEKAKPALPDSEAANGPQNTIATPQAPAPSPAAGAMVMRKAAAPALVTSRQNATWMIAAGVLQRSLDNGQSWQTAARSDHALLCYANRGQEVWAAGQAGTLLHSSDGGATWSAVNVSFEGHALSSDVTRIDVSSPVEIVLATNSHETWSSSDDGKTWVRK